MTNIFDIFHKKKKNVLLIDYIRDYAKNSKREEAYKRVYRGLARKVEDFSHEYHYDIYTDGLTNSIAEEFIHFLRGQKLRHNTIRSLVSKMITILNRADKEGLPINRSIEDCQLQTEEVITTYLNEAELKIIAQLKLSPEATIVRDLFIIGCYTGLRYSDLKRLTQDNFINGRVIIRTLKTGVITDVPIHPFIKPILEKYNYMPPRQKSDQNFNSRIKSICKKAGFTEPVTCEYTEGYRKITKKVPKYKMISSHTCRRSLATNMYLAGEKIFRIMLITGHKTEECFFRYIRISRSENAKELSKRGFFAGETLNLSV